jgi:predicted dehydrogenase
MAVIGTGTRGNQVHTAFIRNTDVVFVAACDVAKSRLDQFASKVGGKIATYGDYRRVLENKDVEAVLVSTPDHWHSPIMMAACEAGKDVYVEKPVSNAIDPALKMIDAARKYNRVVQVGLQQRSWHHFQECAKMVRDGYIGKINQCVMLFGGGGGGMRMANTPTQVPADLDWDMWQGPAPHHAYTEMRQRFWRNFYDYGGGSITDWGVHLADVMNWYMEEDAKSPLLTNSAGQYVSIDPPDPDQVPDTFSVTWTFDKFVATFTNAVPPSQDPSMPMSDLYGNYFYGEKGMLLVNRYGYQIKPNPPRRQMQMGPNGPVPAPNAAVQPAIEAKNFVDPAGMAENPDTEFGSGTVRHTRNFLDCVKSRQRPVCDIEIGFHSSLPCLLAVLAVKQGRSYVWDGKTAKPA